MHINDKFADSRGLDQSEVEAKAMPFQLLTNLSVTQMETSKLGIVLSDASMGRAGSTVVYNFDGEMTYYKVHSF